MNWLEKNGALVLPGSLTISGATTISSGNLTISTGSLVMGSTTLSAAELGVLDGITNGTAAVSKALVLDSSGDLTMVSGRTLNMNSGTISSLNNVTTGKVNLRYDLASGSTGGNQGSFHSIIKRNTSINNNSLTTVLTITIPNLNNAAIIKLHFLATLGSTDVAESTRGAEATLYVARVANGDTVITSGTLYEANIATTSGGATLTLGYTVGSITGASNASQTATIGVTIVASGATNSNTCLVVAEVLNDTSSGVTVS